MGNDEKERGPPFEYRSARRKRPIFGGWSRSITPVYPLPHGDDDFPSRIKERGRSMMWLGGALAIADVVGSLLLGSLGLDVYWMPVRPDVAIGCVAVFLVGFGILMQVWDSTPHTTSIEEE